MLKISWLSGLSMHCLKSSPSFALRCQGSVLLQSTYRKYSMMLTTASLERTVILTSVGLSRRLSPVSEYKVLQKPFMILENYPDLAFQNLNSRPESCFWSIHWLN